MSLLVTDALVLHAFDYLESSRIVRLLTRDVGVRSAVARGARRSSRRFGTSIDLFAEGTAELHTRPGRELDTLGAFDVVHSHATIGAGLERFTGAAMLAELTLRFATHGGDEELFETVRHAVAAIAEATPDQAPGIALAGAWAVIATLGFGPMLDECAQCHRAIPDGDDATFNHSVGGTLCATCAQGGRVGRRLPAAARHQLVAWMQGEAAAADDPAVVRAHQRLLREFLQEHLADGRPLRAFDVWERDAWSAA